MRFAAWSAELAEPQHGAPLRAHLEMAAKRGNAGAIAKLTPPYFPVTVGYLLTWVHELRKGLGFGEHGMNALTWESLDAWCRRTWRDPLPMEVEALFELDAVLRNPNLVEEPA